MGVLVDTGPPVWCMGEIDSTPSRDKPPEHSEVSICSGISWSYEDEDKFSFTAGSKV